MKRRMHDDSYNENDYLFCAFVGRFSNRFSEFLAKIEGRYL